MDFEIIYSARKTVAITVKKDGGVCVRAPHGTGEEFLRQQVKTHTLWIEKARERIMKKESSIRELSEDDIERLRKEAREYLTEKTKWFSNIMGLNYGRISITKAKTRYGSCSSKGNISYSLYLMLKSEPFREYVVVHELAHIVHMNHSKKFYALIEKYMPDYRERKKMR